VVAYAFSLAEAESHLRRRGDVSPLVPVDRKLMRPVCQMADLLAADGFLGLCRVSRTWRELENNAV
jgi:hypothetical protein